MKQNTIASTGLSCSLARFNNFAIRSYHFQALKTCYFVVFEPDYNYLNTFSFIVPKRTAFVPEDPVPIMPPSEAIDAEHVKVVKGKDNIPPGPLH